MRRTTSTRAVALGLLIGLVGLVALLGTGPATAHQADDAPTRRVVRVGTEGTYPPFTHKDPRTDRLAGYDIEVMRAAKASGIVFQSTTCSRTRSSWRTSSRGRCGSSSSRSAPAGRWR